MFWLVIVNIITFREAMNSLFSHTVLNSMQCLFKRIKYYYSISKV